MSASVADYIFVDTATGGVNRRNHVMWLDEFTVNGSADVYTTYHRGTRDFLDWRNSHQNKDGNPTVAGFPGPTMTPFLPLDHDCEADPGRALEWVRKTQRWLDAAGVRPHAVRYYFSGCKGFGVEIPHALFGGFEPSVELPQYCKAVAERIMDGIPFDHSVYDRVRLWRVPNTRHSKTNLYKIQLTADEVRTLSIEAIRELAQQPRGIASVPELAPILDDDWHPVDTLVDLWQEARRAVAQSTQTAAKPRGAITDDERDRLTVAALATSWPYGGVQHTGISRHADFLMPVLGYLTGRLSANKAGALAKAAALQANDPTFLQGREWEAEIDRLAESSAAKWATGEKVIGLPTLGERFAALAGVLAAVWPAPTFEIPEDAPAARSPAVAPMTLAQVAHTFRRWLYLTDLGALYAVLGTIAANLMNSDPVWLMLVGPSSGGKTEILNSTTRLPHIHVAATLTEGALLSGTARKDKDKAAKGGLLREIGAFGILVLKDFTSILSMNRDPRAALLAALREIFDGSWTRHVGIDGGRTLHWEGKVGLVAGCTTTIDGHHTVVSTMGERFVLYRTAEINVQRQGERALENTGHERQMRQQLADAVAGLFAGLDLADKTPPPLTPEHTRRLVAIAALAARTRSPVERDGRTHEIELIPDSEAPARIGQTLQRLYGGLRAIGLPERRAWKVITKVALDCMPKLRGGIFTELARADEWRDTVTLASAVAYPTVTARRALEDLAVHGVVQRRIGGKGKADLWNLTRQAAAWYAIALGRPLPEKSVETLCASERV